MNVNDLNEGWGAWQRAEVLTERLGTVRTCFLFAHNIPNKMTSHFNYCFYRRS